MDSTPQQIVIHGTSSIDDTVTGNITVVYGALLKIYGNVRGRVLVERGATLEIHGTVVGDVMVRGGGWAFLYGRVTQDVYNQGGNLEVVGSIGGQLHAEGDATYVAPDARIGRGCSRSRGHSGPGNAGG